MSDEPIRVVVADAQAMFRSALREMLDSTGEFSVVGVADTAESAASAAARNFADVALIDAALRVNGSHPSTLVDEAAPACRSLVISEGRSVDQLLAALEAGAGGFVLKTQGLRDLVEAARCVHRGDVYVPREMLRELLETLLPRRREREESVKIVRSLTPRERDVLRWLVDGLSPREMAKRAVISTATARTHVQNVLDKLQVHSRVQAIAFAHRHGLVELLDQ